MQRVCQKHICNAVSKTLNLTKETSEEELSDIIMEFLPELKGLTVYPDGSREDQPLTPMSLDGALKYIKEGKDTKIEATVNLGAVTFNANLTTKIGWNVYLSDRFALFLV